MMKYRKIEYLVHTELLRLYQFCLLHSGSYTHMFVKQPTDLTMTSKDIKLRALLTNPFPTSYRLTNDGWHVKTIGNGDVVLIKALKKGR